MLKNIVLIFSFIIFLTAIFSVTEYLSQEPVTEISLKNSSADLSDIDFENDLVYVTGDQAYYPNNLYMPSDFSGNKTEPSVKETAEMKSSVDYGTHRFTVKLPQGKTYAVTGMSTQYSMAMYVNGELITEVGHPSTNSALTVPATKQYTASFTPQSDTTEFVVHFANFNHKTGGGYYPVTIGNAENIGKMNEKSVLSSYVQVGCMLTIFIFLIGMFLFYKQRSFLLYFALSSLAISIMAFFGSEKLIMLFFPDMGWHASMSIEYLCSLVVASMFAAYLNSLYPKLLNKVAFYAFQGWSLIYALVILFTKPRIYTEFLIYYQIGLFIFIVYILIRLAMNLEKNKMEKILIFVGAAMFIVMSALEQFFNSFSIWVWAGWMNDLSQIGMMICIFFNITALALYFGHMEVSLERANQTILEAEKNINHILAEQNISKKIKLEDFGLTKRESDVVWLLLDGKTRPQIADTLNISMGTVNSYCSNIYSKTNCNGHHDLLRLFGIPSKRQDE